MGFPRFHPLLGGADAKRLIRNLKEIEATWDQSHSQIENRFLGLDKILKILSAVTLSTALYRVLWTKTASTAVANTGAETTLLDAGVGSKTLATAFFTIGKTLFFEVVGYYSNLLTPTLQFKMKLGGTTILDSGAILTPGTVANQQFRFRGQLTCRTTGATGTVMAQGEVVLAGLSTPLVTITNTAVTTIDTTAALAAEVTLTWGTANAANTATATNGQIEAEG